MQEPTIESMPSSLPSESTNTTPGRKVFVETWGCQMNVADSEKMLGILGSGGYETTTDVGEADLVLLNTCHIREKARQKVLSRLGVLRGLKEKRPGMQIAVAGCVAQAEGNRLINAAPQIDVLLGPGRIDTLPELLDRARSTGKSAIATGFKREKHHDHVHDEADQNGTSAHSESAETIAPAVVGPNLSGKNEITRFVTIIQGCNNYCTFCVVPFTRGSEISRPALEIKAEVRAMLATGAREIMLLGQNVNSWGLDFVQGAQGAQAQDGSAFVNLLQQVASEPDLLRLRFTTSNPHDFTPALANLFASEPKLGRYMHLPVQSGDDRILGLMKRKVTVAEYRERIAWLRAAVPDIAISTDLIVGFPGETEAEFENTLALVEEVGFAFSYSFKYSPRKNTVAARMPNQVPEDVMDRRLARLIALQDQITTAQHEQEIGRDRAVLFTYESRKEAGVFYGRTEHYRLVRVNAARNLTGTVQMVKITGGNKTALVGELS